ncbi:MAG: 2OG-Fe(II) oxygenase family protein [Pseudomonadota bacterium]
MQKKTPEGPTTDSTVPTINLAAYQQGRLDEAKLHALAEACEDHGFFLLENHGSEELVERTFATSKRFFDQPKAQKMAVFRDELNPLGYFDRELTKQKRDLKEVYDFKAGGYISSNPAKQTRWPDDVEFKDTLTEFFVEFTALANLTMEMIFVSLGMQGQQARQLVATSFGDSHSSAARLNYYPASDPVPSDQRQNLTELGDMALHHHTDPGAITLLLQDDHGGLQTLSKKHGWIDVPPRKGAIVVNVGDVLQVWTNDRCTAATHRVLPVQSQRGRYSTPFFFQPRYDATIEPWVEGDQRPIYRAFSWREFIRGRVTDNFSDYGEQDIQISRYRLAS